jgi:hypothetical protein
MSEAEVSQVRMRGARPPRLAPVATSEVHPLDYTQPVQTVTVLPAEINLHIYQGDDFFLDLTVTDQNNNPLDVTNSSVMSQIRSSFNSPNLLANIGIIIDGTTVGLIHMHLAAQDSDNLPLACVWDIQLSSPAVQTIAAGTVTVTPQVTQ